MKLRPAMPTSEHQIQAQLCAELALLARPDILWFAIANGGLRNIRVATRLKAEGVRRGSPDMAFVLPAGKTIWLELKTAKGRQSVEQKGFQANCSRLGHTYAVAHSVDEALGLLKFLGALR